MKNHSDLTLGQPAAEKSQVFYRVIARRCFGDYVDMWGLQRLHQKDWGKDRLATLRIIASGKNVDVYLVDSGIKAHSEFEDMDSGESRVSFLFDAYGQHGEDRLGHGTHIASIIAGRTVGVAPQASIWNVKVFDQNTVAAESDLLAGLQAVLDHHRNKKSDRPGVMNLSVVTEASYLVDNKIREMISAGIIVTVASGWHKRSIMDFSPAHLPEVLTIASMDINDQQSDKNNLGEPVDFFAPGEDIEGASTEDYYGYRSMSGSSASCAYAAGLAALVLEKNTKMDIFELRKVLIDASLKDSLKGVPQGTPNRLLQNPMIDLGPKWSEGQQSLLGVFGWGQNIECSLELEQSAIQHSPPKKIRGELPPGMTLSGGKISGVLPAERPANLPIQAEKLDYFNFLVEVENQFGRSEKLFFIVVADPIKLKDFDLTKAHIAHIQKGVACIATSGSGSGTS